MMIAPVMTDENPRMQADTARTVYRADETPVRRETTTKMFRGTRNSDDNYDHNQRLVTL